MKNLTDYFDSIDNNKFEQFKDIGQNELFAFYNFKGFNGICFGIDIIDRNDKIDMEYILICNKETLYFLFKNSASYNKYMIDFFLGR